MIANELLIILMILWWVWKSCPELKLWFLLTKSMISTEREEIMCGIIAMLCIDKYHNYNLNWGVIITSKVIEFYGFSYRARESTMWSDIWNVSYIELRIWNQVSHDHRSYERNLSNCVEKPEKVRTSTGFEPVASTDNTDLGFHNSWYHAQPHPIIVY